MTPMPPHRRSTLPSGLQAEGLDIELGEVTQDETHATAKYKVTWDLPKDRTLSYDTEMTLTKKDKDWQVRWQPSLVHPNPEPTST